MNIELAFDINEPLSLAVIQRIVTIVQQQIYRMEGSLNKVVSYNNGLTVIACWGVSPYSHDDDAARAVYATLNIQRKLARLA